MDAADLSVALVTATWGTSVRSGGFPLCFFIMAGPDIRSIEQTKHVRSREANVVLGLGTVPSKSMLGVWFYEVARQGLARLVLNDYFRLQIRAGLVGLWICFTDGHLLPYTGKEKVHYNDNTQRRMPVPGRTSPEADYDRLPSNEPEKVEPVPDSEFDQTASPERSKIRFSLAACTLNETRTGVLLPSTPISIFLLSFRQVIVPIKDVPRTVSRSAISSQAQTSAPS